MDNYTFQVAPQRRFSVPRPVKIGVIIAFGLMLMIGLIMLVNPSDKTRAARVSKDFLTYFIINPDPTKGYSLTSSTFQSNMSSDKFNSESKRLHAFFTKPYKQTSKKDYDFADSWLITYETDGKDGHYIFSAIVVKENKKLLVQYYETSRQ